MSLLSAKALFLFWDANMGLRIMEIILFLVKDCDQMERRRQEDMLLSAPNSEGNVWPRQVCPAFEPRANTPDGLHQCWYCRCADFHLDKPKALEVGICYWPEKIIK